MSLVRTYWNDFKVGDIIYVKGNDTPLTIKKKVNEDGIMGFTIDLEVKPSSPYSWVPIDYVDETKLSPIVGPVSHGGARRHKNRKSTKKARKNHRYYSRGSRRN
jgi:hypothetical protein